MSDNLKKIGYIALGVGALVTVALLFNNANSKDSKEQGMYDQISALGPPQKGQNGLLTFDFFKQVFMIVNKYSKEKFSEQKKEYLAQRRQALKDGEDAKYSELVKQAMQKEEMQFSEVLTEALDFIGVNEQEFMHMQ